MMWQSMITRMLSDQNINPTKESINDVLEELTAQQASWKISAKKREVIANIVLYIPQLAIAEWVAHMED